MSEMVDRVARAIAERHYAGLPGTKHLVETNWRTFIGDAEAAIEAMREPTDAMIKAGAARLDDDWCTETNALNIWQAMIDEALK